LWRPKDGGKWRPNGGCYPALESYYNGPRIEPINDELLDRMKRVRAIRQLHNLTRENLEGHATEALEKAVDILKNGKM